MSVEAGFEQPAGSLGQAPVFLWLLVLGAVLWWLWPFLVPYFQKAEVASSAPPRPIDKSAAASSGPRGTAENSRALSTEVAEPASGEEASLCSATAPTDVDRSAPVVDIIPGATFAVANDDVMTVPTASSCSASVLGIDVAGEFAAAFDSAVQPISEAMKVPPQGPEYTAATAVMHRIGEILDRIFEKWGSFEERAKFSRLREGTSTFNSIFGKHKSGDAGRALLQLAGFERSEDGIWALPLDKPQAILHAMSVRLCLQKHTELQKTRGAQVWAQTSNESVVPTPGSADAAELLVLYRTYSPFSPPNTSWRERNTEVAVRARIHERRQEVGLKLPLALHEGLASAARVLANDLRTTARSKYNQATAVETRSLPGPTEDQVRELIAMLPLPSGYDAVLLHCTTTELPHVFGLASTTGKSNADSSEGDKAAELIANEIAGHWGTWKAQELSWASATIYGVGTCLDYTINRGFVVALLAGFEGLIPTQELTAARKERSELKQRKAELPKHPAQPFGARVQTFDSIGPSESRRRPGGG